MRGNRAFALGVAAGLVSAGFALGACGHLDIERPGPPPPCPPGQASADAAPAAVPAPADAGARSSP